MKSGIHIICVVTLFTGLTYADRTVWYVHPDSSLNTIQAGLDSCADNDIVLVGPGTYFENIVWPNTQGIHLIGELGLEMTIIDGDTAERVITIWVDVDTTTLIRGFTIQNGGTHGIYIPSSTPTISNNLIQYNEYDGVHTCGGCPVLYNNIITHNGQGLGTHGGNFELFDNIVSYNIGDGLIFMSALTPMYRRFEITGNTFSYNGGYGIGECDWLILKNATITHNGAGGLGWISGLVDIDSCTIAHNYGPGVTTIYPSIVTINYCYIFDNIGYGILNQDTVWISAEYNWWGDSTGPYHPDSNPGGLGDSVSDYVDFIPWLYWPGIEDRPTVKPVIKSNVVGATIFSGPLVLPKGKSCKVFDITGRMVEPNKVKAGVYFIEIDGKITQKVIKIK